MKNLRFLATACALLLAGCSESADDYRVKAIALQKANDIAGSERVLHEGIKAHPDNENLPALLMILYKESEQWDKMASYIAVAPGFKGDANYKYGNYWALGEHYFDSRDYNRAYKFFTDAGDSLGSIYAITDNPFLRDYCPKEAALAYRNAAGAAGRMRDFSRMRQSFESIKELTTQPRCQSGNGADEVRDYAIKVQGWLADR